ncbi:MAG: hypothetical protein IKW92_07950 [Firmicutes bacterium]|jgi:hypothetical protein|nr:hypothetical protein [Bacillota bacterium]
MKKTKKEEKTCCGRKLLGKLLKMALIWCAAVSIYKTHEANEAAKMRREAREAAAQEWEFDRVYPGALRDR